MSKHIKNEQKQNVFNNVHSYMQQLLHKPHILNKLQLELADGKMVNADQEYHECHFYFDWILGKLS